jgi:CobQ-like glutamine amidotransferase family enzyme
MSILKSKVQNSKLSLKIAWLYPDLMSTYGDRGNIIVLQKRCEWRGIGVNIEKIYLTTNYKLLSTCDLLFMGGAQDTQQEIVNKDLFENKGKVLLSKIEQGVPGLFICGAYQFLGKFYKTADGTILPGLSLFPIYTENPGGDRLIGNILVKAEFKNTVVGFENHGGRTHLEDGAKPFAKVLKGYGNNGEDKTEGIIYKNAIGTYLHGPILPKNPELADWLIQKALEVKYKKEIELDPLDDSMEQKARKVIVNRIT